MTHTFEVEGFEAVNSEGEIVYKCQNTTLDFNSTDPAKLTLNCREIEVNEDDKVFPFFLSQITSCCRIGNKGYVFNFPDNSCYVITFRCAVNVDSFDELIQTHKKNDAAKSKFCNRTEESSAAQYFQFYGYLSQQQNMLQDYIRTSTYEKAVLANTVDFEGKVVLDVGAGSGILSFFSVQGGASRVYAVEASSMAEHAELLVSFNYLNDKIVVIAGKIEEIDLPEQVDVIISEPMGYMLYNERMLETYLYAKKWLKPDGKMFPTVGDLQIAPFTDEALFMEQTTKASFWLQTHFHNIDLTVLHDAAIAEYFRQPIVDTFDIRMCTARSIRHSVNFLEAEESDLHLIEIPLDFTLTQTATIHGLAFWFDVAFIGSSQTVWLSTAPTEALTHWYQVRCLLVTPIFGKVNQRLVGKVVLEANTRQSYDVNIEVMIDGLPDTRSVNKLDLKNPYFRYTGQTPAAPPGSHNTSPTEGYWNQLEGQTVVRQIPNASTEVTLDIEQWPNTEVHLANNTNINNTVNMVNGISLNGYNEIMDTPMPQSVSVITMPSSVNKTNSATSAFVEDSAQRTPGVIMSHISQVIVTNNRHYVQNNGENDDMIEEYVSTTDVLNPHLA